MTEYLDKERITAINKEATRASGDPHGIISEGNLNHLDSVKDKYNDADDSIILKAAFLLDYIANKGHIFIEGNKRTAETATIAFLGINGLEFEENDQDDLANFVLSVARNERSTTAIAKWLKQRVKKA